MEINFMLHKEVSRSSPKQTVEEVPSKSPGPLMVPQARGLPQWGIIGTRIKYYLWPPDYSRAVGRTGKLRGKILSDVIYMRLIPYPARMRKHALSSTWVSHRWTSVETSCSYSDSVSWKRNELVAHRTLTRFTVIYPQNLRTGGMLAQVKVTMRYKVTYGLH